MSSRIVTVGRGKRATSQIITTTFDADGRELVTLATPAAVDDTQRLRALTLRQYDSLTEEQKVLPS